MDRIKHVLDLIAGFSDAERAIFGQKFECAQTLTPAPLAEKKTVTAQAKKKIRCPQCDSSALKKHGKYRDRSRYKCLSCTKTFNDFTNTPLAGIHSTEKIREFASGMAQGGVSLRKSAEEFDISLPTAFNWRHKIIQGYTVAEARKLSGIAEADETFFLYSEKGSKTVSKFRKPRKRGGKAKKTGISNEQVPVLFGCDRQGELILGVAGKGRISLKDIEDVLGDRIDDEATLCTDSHASFRAFAKNNRIKYRPVNVSKGQRVVKKVFHVQHVNSAHARMKGWMTRFKGVSTKHLNSYAQWFGLMEETKSLNNREEKFADRSVAQRRRIKPQSS